LLRATKSGLEKRFGKAVWKSRGGVAKRLERRACFSGLSVEPSSAAPNHQRLGAALW
jgi:hypothetical protein